MTAKTLTEEQLAELGKRQPFERLISAEARAALAAMPEEERQRFKRALALRLAMRELPVAGTGGSGGAGS